MLKILGQKECCNAIEISSTGIAKIHQSESLGIFKYRNRTDNRMVYSVTITKTLNDHYFDVLFDDVIKTIPIF